MTCRRTIALDATFMIAYIGVTALMVAMTVTLWALSAIGTEFGPMHTAAALVNVLGWAALPFASQLYGRIAGTPFRWRANAALGGITV